MPDELRETIRIPIIGGGDKFELFQQLMLIGIHESTGAHINGPLFRVELQGPDLMPSREDLLHVYGLKSEDEFGYSWEFTGALGPAGKQWERSPMRLRGGTFVAHYNTESRMGWIDITYN